MPTALQTSGFPLSADYTVPLHVMDRPTPPPATGEQPFGFRFRGVLRPSGETSVNPVYDPERQVTWIDGRLPDIKMGGGGGTEEIEPKIKWKIVEGQLIPDITYDFKSDE